MKMARGHLAACAVLLLTACSDAPPAPPPSTASDGATTSDTAEAAAQSPATQAGRGQPDSVVVYEHIYPYNTETLIENHYIELAFHPDTITGRYYGTTDDFDNAREGYLPGFFVTTMNDLRIAPGTISFTLAPWDYFTTPRTPGMDQDAPGTDLTRWKVTTPLAPSRSYTGQITPDRINLQSPSGPREFTRPN